jgi:hypothetical protein
MWRNFFHRSKLRRRDLARAAAIATMLASAAAGAQAPAADHAERVTGLTITQCFGRLDAAGRGDDAQCPGYLVEPLRQARDLCEEVDGALKPLEAPEVWGLDVNRDGHTEYVFELEGVVTCEGAPGVFSCGSLGCPKVMYEESADGWRAIAEVWAYAPAMLEVLVADAAQPYGDLRVGCVDAAPCDEYWYSQWRGNAYERTHLDVRGHRVEFSDSIHGLYGVVGAIDVLATPTDGAAVIGHYSADTDVEIVGTAAEGEYYYVSPCNACESGFVPKSAVHPLQY